MSRTPSYSQSIGQRRTASGTVSVPDIPLQVPLRHISRGTDVISGWEMADLAEAEKVDRIKKRGSENLHKGVSNMRASVYLFESMTQDNFRLD